MESRKIGKTSSHKHLSNWYLNLKISCALVNKTAVLLVKAKLYKRLFQRIFSWWTWWKNYLLQILLLMKMFFYNCTSIFKLNNSFAFKNDKTLHFENFNHANHLLHFEMHLSHHVYLQKTCKPKQKTYSSAFLNLDKVWFDWLG